MTCLERRATDLGTPEGRKGNPAKFKKILQNLSFEFAIYFFLREGLKTRMNSGLKKILQPSGL